MNTEIVTISAFSAKKATPHEPQGLVSRVHLEEPRGIFWRMTLSDEALVVTRGADRLTVPTHVLMGLFTTCQGGAQ